MPATMRFRFAASLALSLFFLIVLVVSSLPGRARGAPESRPAVDRAWVEKHRGKAGFYLRLAEAERQNKPEFYLSHHLVDAVVLTFKWAQTEPAPGQFDYAQIDQLLGLCKKHNKGFVLGLSTYGQSPGDQPTPDWLYEKGVKGISFAGGGVAKGSPITVPKVWDEAYFPEYERFVQALGRRYDGQPGIWYIMPAYGHIGNLNAQPSKGGGPAFLAEGWTPQIWKDFCRRVTRLYQSAFPNTPLLVKSAAQLLKDRENGDYLKEADEILAELASMGVSVITFGLEPQIEPLLKNNVLGRVAALAPYALTGQIRVGIGDDWPLWVPENRRKNEKFLAGRDEAGLAKELQYAFGGLEGLPPTHVSLMYVLHPEIEASHPQLGAGQNKKLYDILAAARARLKQEDPIDRLPESL